MKQIQHNSIALPSIGLLGPTDEDLLGASPATCSSRVTVYTAEESASILNSLQIEYVD